MMAPQPMAMNNMTNTNVVNNTTVIQQQRDPYMDKNGAPEDRIDREFRIMAATQVSCPGMWCISCKQEVPS